jgi:D-3-phosphoglycerate dehydrogenase
VSYKVLVLEGITDRGLAILKEAGFAVDLQKALSPDALAGIIAPYDALLIRSGCRITPEVLDAATRLRIIGRPGVGVDNVDLEAATRRGVVVMNSPGGNLVSTAELALGLLFAVARNIPQADAAIKAERWDRKAFAGVELHGKRIGVLGLGRIGREVAQRCRALGMEVVAYDPFVAQGIADGIHVRLMTLDEVLGTSHFLTIHTTLTKETRHLLGKEAFSKMKPGIRIVNAARGELVDEDALLAALESGKVAGAALDVHAQEPPTDWTLAQHPGVIATPHIGAATAEAQERVGTDIAAQVRDFLLGGVIQQAVNFFSLSGDLYDQVRPAMDLAERLGTFLAQVCRGPAEKVEVGLYGEFCEIDVKPILSAAVTGVLRSLQGGVTLVNALQVAKERGIDVLESTSSAHVAFSNLMLVRLKTSDDDFSVGGTLFGRNHLRLVEVDGVEVDTILQGRILYVKNDDTPGVVGHLGTLLGESSVNIARMTVGRKPGSGRAVMLLEVESALPEETLAKILEVPGVRDVRAINLG